MSRARKTATVWPKRRLFSAEENAIIAEAVAQGLKPMDVATKIDRTTKAVSQCMSRMRCRMRAEMDRAATIPLYAIHKLAAPVDHTRTPPIMSDTFRRMNIVADSRWFPAVAGPRQ